MERNKLNFISGIIPSEYNVVFVYLAFFLIFMAIFYLIFNRDPHRKRLQKAIDAYYAGNYGDALNIAIPLASYDKPPLFYRAKNWFLLNLVEQDAVNIFENGDPSAQHILGLIYKNGYGVSKNLEIAESWLRKASDQDNLEAQYNLASLLLYELQDRCDEAIELYKLAASKGDHDALYMLGYLYYEGELVAQDYTEAFGYFKSAVLQFESADAQTSLGNMYHNGEGCNQNFSEANELWKSASEQGSSAASHNLASSYLEGKGIEKSTEKAVEFFDKAGDQGDTSSYIAAAYIYIEENEIEPDFAKLESLLSKAMMAGDLDAQGLLAALMISGEAGFPENFDEGIKLAKDAADKGSTNAAELLSAIDQELGPEAYRKVVKTQKEKASSPQTKNPSSENNIIKFPKR